MFLIALNAGCDFDLFGPSPIVQVRSHFSPSHIHKAIVCCRGGGTTTDYATAVYILKSNELTIDQNTQPFFAADTDHSLAPRAEWGGPDVEIMWISEHEIEVAHHQKTRIFLSANEVGDIKIRYRIW